MYWRKHVRVLQRTRKHRDFLRCILLPPRYGMCHIGGACTLTRPRLTVIMSYAPSSPRWPPSPVVSSYLTVEQEDARAVAAVMIPSIYSESEFSSECNEIVGSEVASIVTLA